MTTRQRFITDVVEHWIKNHPKEYKTNMDLVKEKRGKLWDKNLGKVKGQKGMRPELKIYNSLFNALDMSLDEPRFLRDPKELRWFCKRFPQFQVPYEY